VITNPFDQDPFARSQAVAWGQGFLSGLTGPFESNEQAPEGSTEDVLEAFDQDVLAGRQAAIDRLDIFPRWVNTEDARGFPHHPVYGCATIVDGYVRGGGI
jgi:hypothetical protein